MLWSRGRFHRDGRAILASGSTSGAPKDLRNDFNSCVANGGKIGDSTLPKIEIAREREAHCELVMLMAVRVATVQVHVRTRRQFTASAEAETRQHCLF